MIKLVRGFVICVLFCVPNLSGESSVTAQVTAFYVGATVQKVDNAIGTDYLNDGQVLYAKQTFKVDVGANSTSVTVKGGWLPANPVSFTVAVPANSTNFPLDTSGTTSVSDPVPPITTFRASIQATAGGAATVKDLDFNGPLGSGEGGEE